MTVIGAAPPVVSLIVYVPGARSPRSTIARLDSAISMQTTSPGPCPSRRVIGERRRAPLRRRSNRGCCRARRRSCSRRVTMTCRRRRSRTERLRGDRADVELAGLRDDDAAAGLGGSEPSPESIGAIGARRARSGPALGARFGGRRAAGARTRCGRRGRDAEVAGAAAADATRRPLRVQADGPRRHEARRAGSPCGDRDGAIDRGAHGCRLGPTSARSAVMAVACTLPLRSSPPGVRRLPATRRHASVSALRRASRSAAGGPPPRPDLGVLREEVAELVRARQDHPLGERVDVEVDGRAVGQQDALLGEVDGQLGVGVGREELEQPGVGRRVDDDRQHAVLEAVAAEDVGVRGREDRPDAPRGQRPRRVLA